LNIVFLEPQGFLTDLMDNKQKEQEFAQRQVAFHARHLPLPPA
jgi:hypothetical protein